MCSGLLCCICGLISLSSGLFLWFLISRFVQVLFLSLVVNFYCHFPVITLKKDLFSSAYLNKLLSVWCLVTALYKGSTRLGGALLENRNEASFQNIRASLLVYT
jgi:hypothetical protein